MNTQHYPGYQKAWAAYVAANHDVTKLSWTDLQLLREDDATRKTIDARPPVVVAPSPSPLATKAGPPPMPDAEEMRTALFTTIEAYLESGLTGLDSTKSGLGDVVRQFAGKDATPRAFMIRYQITRDALEFALRVIGHLNTEMKKLHATVTALEAAPTKGVVYRGVWRQDVTYAADAMVTHGGSLWAARTASVSRRPGADDGSGAWQLCCKKGSDGAPGKDGVCGCAAGDKDPK